ncbi:hypothetical protein [uncultured Butyricimonas sp.]|uniref:hypothetical protein n=1 Tax=uncultured Butyricimonas sp. TaxID=1268785 RepID=UPI0025972BDE|nr:hypothetical protein [uncultured Butyricimonas sp.]MDY5488819.1 hypothetical protein [Butyricimonas virosa]
MRRINIYWLVLSIFLCVACAGNDNIGDVEPLSPDYKLPQGKSPADDRIVEYYDQYGTYILYEYTNDDIHYGSYYEYTYNLPDPQYVGNMLDLLEDIWFDLYPIEFHRKYMPYAIFLTADLNGPLGPVFSYDGTSSLVLGKCSEELEKITAETKFAYKKELQIALWNMWLNKSVFEFPDEFFKVSDYSRTADADPSSPNYARNRGFVAHYQMGEWSLFPTDWMTGTLGDVLDLSAFIMSMISRTSDEWASDLTYPLVKKKYDILQNYFLKTYNVNLKNIGNTVY